MDEDLSKTLNKAANTIRALSFEAVQKANSGHPGLPMGCAEIGAYLYGEYLKHNPENPNWANRDRFILSAGHGSMLLYSCLHLSGFEVSLEDLKNFRQLHSKTPGHPEAHETPGVETTTGPLGQGVANAVGQALGFKLLQTKFNTEEHKLFDNKVVCLAGDGCLMEGISHEACSLAGHLGLDNFILVFDSNKITLDGPLEQCGSEDTVERFKAYGFDVMEMDGNNLEDVQSTFAKTREVQTKPILIIAHTVIGKGSPAKQGTHNVHGSPLGPEECEATKKALGISEEDFYIPQAVKNYFESHKKKGISSEEEWNEMFNKWRSANSELAEEYEKMQKQCFSESLEKEVLSLEMPDSISGRKAAQAVLQILGKQLPQLYGGSADLSGSDCTMMKDYDLVAPKKFSGRNIKYGIREFAMAAAAAGLYETNFITPYVGTFLTFSDYMRNAVRLASLSKYHVIYQFTHDSIFLGEDGPTHQPIEHLAALRAMPNLHVIRPCDSYEVKAAWLEALKYEGPTALVFTRQNLPSLSETKEHSFSDGVGKGAYTLKKESKNVDYILIATGSEVSLALNVARELEKHDKGVRVVSMPCMELFERQSSEYKEAVLGGDNITRVCIEAGVSFGWHKWVGPKGLCICMESFGASAPAADLANEFGFTTESIIERILSN